MIILCSFQYLVVWSLITLTRSKFMLFFARFLSGTAVGTGNAILFIYAGEMSPPKTRGTILSFLYTCYYFGILVEYVLGAYLTYQQVCLVSFGVSISFFGFINFIKESPAYLLSKSKDDKAKEAYKWIHAGRAEDELNKEFEAMKEYANNQRKNKQNGISGFADPINRRCVGLVFIINFLTQLTGLPVLVAFIHTVFATSELISAREFSIIFATIQYIACFCSSSLSDRIGRRLMYKLTCSLCAFCHVLTTILYVLGEQYEIPGISWMLLATISMYACVYAAGLGPLTVIVRGELLPQAVKGIGSGLAVVSAGVSCFLLIFVFTLMEENFGIKYNFVFFSVICISLLILTHFKLPETKHKTLAEIQESFQNS